MAHAVPRPNSCSGTVVVLDLPWPPLAPLPTCLCVKKTKFKKIKNKKNKIIIIIIMGDLYSAFHSTPLPRLLPTPPSGKLQEKMSGLSELQWRPNSTAASRSCWSLPPPPPPPPLNPSFYRKATREDVWLVRNLTTTKLYGCKQKLPEKTATCHLRRASKRAKK